MDEFKLTRALGFEIYGSLGSKFVNASDLEALLAKGVRVYGAEYGDAKRLGGWDCYENGRTHTALLIGIEPIRKESAEDVLRDLCEYIEGNPNAIPFDRIKERARRVLEK